jgi:transcriptional regulator
MTVMTLGAARRMRGLRQEDIAGSMGDTSANWSAAYHLERSPLDSMTMRSLDRYAEAMGARVVLAAVVGDKVIVLTDPEELCQPQA